MDKRFLFFLAAIGLYLYTRPRKAKADGTVVAGSWIMIDGKCFDMQTDAPIECPAEALAGQQQEPIAGEGFDSYAGFGSAGWRTPPADSWTEDADSWTAD